MNDHQLVYDGIDINTISEERNRVARHYEKESKRTEIRHRIEAFRDIQGNWGVLSYSYSRPCDNLLEALWAALWMNTEGKYSADAILCDGVEIFNDKDLGLLTKDML